MDLYCVSTGSSSGEYRKALLGLRFAGQMPLSESRMERSFIIAARPTSRGSDTILDKSNKAQPFFFPFTNLLSLRLFEVSL